MHSFQSFGRDEQQKGVERRNKPPTLRQAGCHLHLLRSKQTHRALRSVRDLRQEVSEAE